MTESQTLESMARQSLFFAVTKEAMTRGDPSLRRVIDDTAEAVAALVIVEGGGDLLEFAEQGPALIAATARIMEDAVRTDPDLRAHLVGLRAAVRLRRKLLRGSRRNTTRDEQRQMAHACAEAYCKYHLDQQTASLATLLAHEGPAIRLAAMRLSSTVQERTGPVAVASSGRGSR